MLMCGINALDAQFCDYIFILYYSHLKLSLLLHKTILVTFLLGSTVTWDKLKSDKDKFFLRVASTIIETKCDFWRHLEFGTIQILRNQDFALF